MRPAPLACALACAALCLLSACNKASTPGAGDVLAPPATGRDSFELVIEARPLSLDGFFTLKRVEYDACKLMAELRGVAVKPFPPIPADFIMTRTTRISDGKSFATIERTFYLGKFDVDHGCHADFESDTSTIVSHLGEQRLLDPLDPGEAASEPIPSPTLPFNEDSARGYPITRSINGIALKCADDRLVPGLAKLATDSCIVDPAVARVAGPEGEPIVASLHDRFHASTPGRSEIRYTPVSLRVGMKVAPSVFTQPAAAK